MQANIPNSQIRMSSGAPGFASLIRGSGGAATTQFGSDAANGVIQIFTKRGIQGRSQFSFESSVGAEFATQDFLRYSRTGDILFSPGATQEYRLSASGGTDTFTYR